MRLICALEARSHCSLFCLYLSLCSCDFSQCISIELNSHSDVQTLSSTSTTRVLIDIHLCCDETMSIYILCMYSVSVQSCQINPLIL